MTETITLENRLPGHAGVLSEEETAALKRLWLRLFELFKQKGEAWSAPPPKKPVQKPAKKGWGFGSSKPAMDHTDYFLGATADPRWMDLPLEKAIPLIPGDKLETTFWHMVATDNPDSALLRYLRARKWDFEAAYNMLINTLRWRLFMRVDDIVQLGETGLHDELNRVKPGLGDQFIEQMRSGKATLGGPDRDHRGICFINVQLHHKEDQPFETIKLCALYLMETARVFCGHPMDTACIVFNLDNFTLANMDLDFVKFLIKCLEAYYPETLGLCLIHRAPWVFSTVWSIIQPLLDPVVASKIHFTKNLDEFTKFVEVESVPVIISGNPDRKTKDEATPATDPPAGSLEVPTTPEYLAFEEEKKKYAEDTLAWAQTETKKDDKDDALARLHRGLTYRLARIQAEKVLRAKTIYHQKGLVTLTDEGRLYVDFGTPGFPKQDITDRV